MFKEFTLPKGLSKQPIGDSQLVAIAQNSAFQLNAHLRANPAISESLLLESCDKRYSPSTFLSESVPGRHEGFFVGWFSIKGGYAFVQDHENLYDAATDYVLLSLGLGRWQSNDSPTASP